MYSVAMYIGMYIPMSWTSWQGLVRGSCGQVTQLAVGTCPNVGLYCKDQVQRLYLATDADLSAQRFLTKSGIHPLKNLQRECIDSIVIGLQGGYRPGTEGLSEYYAATLPPFSRVPRES